MHKQFYYQRQHLIHSVDTVLYQLHALSFFLSPSLWLYIIRFLTQHHCSLPGELDSGWPLKILYSLVLLLNAPCLWNHSIKAVEEGRNVVLDFIGMSYTPSRLQLCTLDIIIIVLQLLLVTITYETSLFENIQAIQPLDPLLPDTPVSPSSPTLPTYQVHTPTLTSRPLAPLNTKSRMEPNNIPLILDLRLDLIRMRLRSPPPPIVSRQNSSRNLPLPNTTPWPIPSTLGLLMHATRQVRGAGRRMQQAPNNTPGTGAAAAQRPSPSDGRLPGGLD